MPSEPKRNDRGETLDSLFARFMVNSATPSDSPNAKHAAAPSTQATSTMQTTTTTATTIAPTTSQDQELGLQSKEKAMQSLLAKLALAPSIQPSLTSSGQMHSTSSPMVNPALPVSQERTPSAAAARTPIHPGEALLSKLAAACQPSSPGRHLSTTPKQLPAALVVPNGPSTPTAAHDDREARRKAMLDSVMASSTTGNNMSSSSPMRPMAPPQASAYQYAHPALVSPAMATPLVPTTGPSGPNQIPQPMPPNQPLPPFGNVDPFIAPGLPGHPGQPPVHVNGIGPYPAHPALMQWNGNPAHSPALQMNPHLVPQPSQNRGPPPPPPLPPAGSVPVPFQSFNANQPTAGMLSQHPTQLPNHPLIPLQQQQQRPHQTVPPPPASGASAKPQDAQALLNALMGGGMGTRPVG